MAPAASCYLDILKALSIFVVILLGDVGAEGASSRTDGISNRPKTAVLSLPGSRQGGNEVAAQDHVTLHVTRPQNDTIFHPGNVIVIFETHGFAASVGTPIKVWIPQNGDVPGVLESGNSVILDVWEPCSQLVTLEANVNGQHVSASVSFSIILPTEKLVSSRAPAPTTVAWGVPWFASEHRSNEGRSLLQARPTRCQTTVEHAALIDEIADTSNIWQDHRKVVREKSMTEDGTTIEPIFPSHPLSLLFVGSLQYDGQKAIWVQQMEELPRDRFTSTFLTFQAEDEDSNGGRHRHSGDTVERRLRRAGVPVVKIRAPQVDPSLTGPYNAKNARNKLVNADQPRESDGEQSWNREGNLEGSLMAEPKEVIFSKVLDSFGAAGGVPALMEPAWARSIFEYIAQAVASISPDILILGNARTLGDALLTQATRYVMRPSGRIVMDFPNINPPAGITADVLAMPSHFVAQHPTTKDLAVATGAHVVVIPPGVSFGHSLSRPAIAAPGNEAFSCHFVCLEESEEGIRCNPECIPTRGTHMPLLGTPAPLSVWWVLPERFELEARREFLELQWIPLYDDPLRLHIRSHEEGVHSLVSFKAQVIGFLGRLAPEKGTALFLAVAKGLAELVPSARFVIGGDGPLKPALEAMAERLGISKLVHFEGWVDVEDVSHLLSRMDLIFTPSQWSETFTIVNIEAMAVGTPVASFGVGGMLEYLVPGVNSLLLDDPKPRASAKEIAALIQDPARLAKLGSNARQHITNHFNATAAIKRWAELYEALGRGWGASCIDCTT